MSSFGYDRLPVAVDVMGGDVAPAYPLEGAILAAEKFGVPVVLVGDSKKLGADHGLPVIEASEVVPMGAEPASAVRRLKDSSVVRSAEAVRDGAASSMLSAGNTGAAMAASLLRMGRVKGVSRPAIAVPFPVSGQTPTLLMDCGANADCLSEWLLQFGRMGAAYKRHRWGVKRPKVSLLTIGEESGKGNALVKQAADLFASYDWDSEGAEFIGNVEGNDIYTGVADVVVCDGFTGNTLLKSVEGAFNTLAQVADSFLGENHQQAHKVFVEACSQYHPHTVATGVLLGVKGLSMIAHGSSSPAVIANALRITDELAQDSFSDTLRSSFAGM